MTPTKKPAPRISSAVLEPPPIAKKPGGTPSRAKAPTAEKTLKSPKATPPQVRPAKGTHTTIHHLDHQHIAARAYEIFLERGSSHGHDLEDWEQAEMELCGFSTNRQLEGASHLGKSPGAYLR